jgi:hypothetical protein
MTAGPPGMPFISMALSISANYMNKDYAKKYRYRFRH